MEMSKWHNGPKGPGICRAKTGKCPYGGQSEHYDSKDDAQKEYNKSNESQYGILQGVTKKENKKPNVLAANASGIVQSNSNFINTGRGTSADNEHFESEFTDPNRSAKEIAEDFNSDNHSLGNWKALAETKQKMVFTVKDPFGNTSTVTFMKEKDE